MPTVLRLNGFRFYFFSHEPNEPPHIHVDKGAATIKVWLDSMEIAKSRGFRAHEISAIVEIVRLHKTQFQEVWDEHFR